MTTGQFGFASLWIGLIASLTAVGLYTAAWFVPNLDRRLRLAARSVYGLSVAGTLAGFGALGWIVYNRQYQYDYAFQHTGNDVTNLWYRLSATWSGQEGSFLLWASWTAAIGVMVLVKAGKYETRVMPFYISVLAFLCGILIKQSPFQRFLAVHSDWPGIPVEGNGLTPSLQNYWMTIHPPTIFFGFASLAVPFAYAMGALVYKDYKGWTSRVFPYALLSCATLGLGLFMGGYWAYETQGWHGFWAWDPVENASFFPWLAVTALVHGLVVQKDRGGMARTNTFLGILCFWLFLLGTFLTRSGALASKMADGQLLSVHAFDNISKSGLFLMTTMLTVYGIGGLILWLFRLPSMPTRPTTGESLLSRDFAFFMAILLMMLACAVITLGSTTPLFLSWLHRAPHATQPSFYNKVMMPLTLVAALFMGSVPWLAWRKTDPEKFLKKLIVPWFGMLIFGFALLFWVIGAEKGLQESLDPQVLRDTLHDWINPQVQRICVIALASLGFFVALSNAALVYQVFRKKPINAGGWIAHVGMGVLFIGVILSNTYERTELVTMEEGNGPVSVFKANHNDPNSGYQLSFEGMTGTPIDGRPIDPEYDRHNVVKLRVTPPGANASAGAAQTYVIQPRWFVPRPSVPLEAQGKLEPMIWPSIYKYLGHDLYVGLADSPSYNVRVLTLRPGQHQQVGTYDVFYLNAVTEPLNYMAAQVYIKTAEGQVIAARPGQKWLRDDQHHLVHGDEGQPLIYKVDEEVRELKDDQGRPGAVILESLTPGTQEAKIALSLPGMPGMWRIPLSVTYKPWVNLVWLGVLITVFGTLLAMVRRMREARRAEVEKIVPIELPEREEPGLPAFTPQREPALARSLKIPKTSRKPSH